MDENGIIAKMNVLDTKIAQPLAVQFPHVISHVQLNELDDPWRTFPASAKDLVVFGEYAPDFWDTLGSVKDGLGNSKFPLLSYFMTTMTVLPHSSARVERIFFQINRMNVT